MSTPLCRKRLYWLAGKICSTGTARSPDASSDQPAAGCPCGRPPRSHETTTQFQATAAEYKKRARRPPCTDMSLARLMSLLSTKSPLLAWPDAFPEHAI